MADKIFDKFSGIEVASGFKLQAKAPLDPRFVVDTIVERDALIVENGAYEGMMVYVKETQTVYQLKGTTIDDWSTFTQFEEYSTITEFPQIGEAGKLYIDTSTNITYRWDGADYVAIGSVMTLGETEDTAYRGDRGKIAYDHSQAAHAPIMESSTQLPDDGIVKINTMYFLGEVTTLTVGFPTGAQLGDMVYVSFNSGSIAPIVSVTTHNTVGLNSFAMYEYRCYEMIGLWNGNVWLFVTHEVLI